MKNSQQIDPLVSVSDSGFNQPICPLSPIDALLEVYQRSEATCLVVSNEVGMGVVPPNRLGVLFRDMLGRANQRIAKRADEVMLLVAGLPWKLK